MQLKSNERWIHYFRIFLEYTPRNHPPGVKFDLMKIAKSFIEKYNDNPTQFAYEYNNGKQWVYVAQAQHIDDKLYLLLHQADKEGADPAFINVSSRNVRQEEKNTDEGNGTSIHVAISLTPHSNSKALNQYVMLGEMVPGLTRILLKSFLNFCFSKLVHEYNKDEEGKDRKYRPHIEIYRDVAEDLSQRLKHGTLSEVQFIEEKASGLDDYTKYEKKKLVLSVKYENKPVADIIAWLKDKISTNSGYNKLLVTTKDSNGKAESNLITDFDNQDLSEVAFSRHHKIKLTTPVNSCEKDWVSEIKDAMTLLLS